MRKVLCVFLSAVLLLFSVPAGSSSEALTLPDGYEPQTLARELIASGGRIWQVADRTLLCRELPGGKVISSLPILPGPLRPGRAGSQLYRVNLLAGGEDSVRLCCAFLDPDGTVAVLLAEFRLDTGNRITAGSVQDLTAALGALYAPDAGCLQVEMIAAGDGLFLSAMDEEFNCHLITVSEDGREIRELGQLPYTRMTAALPYGDKLLLAGDSTDRITDVTLSLLSLSDGEIVPLGDLDAGATVTGQNYAYDPEGNRLFYTLRNTVYRAAPEDGNIPEAIAVLPEEPAAFGAGTVAGGRYFVQTEEGNLLSCDTRAELNAVPLRIADSTENTAAEETAAAFNAAHPDTFLAVERADPAAVAAGSHNYDAAILPLSSPECQALLRRGYVADLSGSGLLAEAVRGMEAQLRDVLEKDGILSAFPVSQETSCMTVNVSALQALTGDPGTEIPRDWESLLGLFAALAESGSPAGTEYSVADVGVTAEAFREAMLIRMLRCFAADAALNPDRADAEETLARLLDAFGKVDWKYLIPEEEPENETIPAFSEMLYEISTAYMEPGMAYMPLATLPGREPVIPRQVSVLLVNGASGHRQTLLQWAEELWKQSDLPFRMSLCPGMNEPAANPDYEGELAELEEILGAYEAWITEAGDDPEAEAVRQEAAELREYLAAYRAEARWIVSEESLADYRSRTFSADPCAFWDTDTGLEILEGYLAGEIPEAELAGYLLSLIFPDAEDAADTGV